MTEIRTTSSTGGQKGVKPQRHSLLPKHGLDVIAEVFGFGAEKYDDHNWRRGYEWSKSYDALQRHLTAWWDGEDVDPESGLSHLGHAGFHILVLATWERLDGQGSEFDDRHTFNRDDEECDGSILIAPPAPGELDGWEPLGYIEDEVLEFPVDRGFVNYYQPPILPEPPEGGWLQKFLAGYDDDRPVAIQWRDPADRAFETIDLTDYFDSMREAIRNLANLRAPRFVVDGEGRTTDLRAPIDVPRNIIDALPKHAPRSFEGEIGRIGGIEINVVDEDPHLDYGDLTRDALERTFARRAHGL